MPPVPPPDSLCARCSIAPIAAHVSKGTKSWFLCRSCTIMMTEGDRQVDTAADDASSSSSSSSSSSGFASIESITSSTCYYEILGIPKGTTDAATIKRAYRARAKEVHPDKNKGEGAEAAFKKVSEAFAVLSDEEKRSDYDRFGAAAGGGGGGGAGGNPFARYAGRARQAGMSPEEQMFAEMFGNFFGGGAAFGNHGGAQYVFMNGRPVRVPRGGDGHHSHGGRRGGPPAGGGVHLGCGPLFNLFAPFLLMVLLTFFTGGSSDPFSLTASSRFPVRTHTTAASVPADLPFYVDESYSRLNPSAREQVQRQVYATYDAYCSRERQRVANAMSYDLWSGSYRHTARSRRAAQAAVHCEALGVHLL